MARFIKEFDSRLTFVVVARFGEPIKSEFERASFVAGVQLFFGSNVLMRNGLRCGLGALGSVGRTA